MRLNGYLQWPVILLIATLALPIPAQQQDTRVRYRSIFDAVIAGDSETVQRYIDAGVDVNGTNGSGDRPLDVAARADRPDVIALLKRHRANPNLTHHVTGRTPMHRAAERGRAASIIALSEAGGRVDARDKNGETPLLMAAKSGKRAAVKALLNLGANVQLADRTRQTLLHLAARNGQADLVRLALEKGARIDDTAHNGRTPLHYAADAGRVDVVRVLLDHGADINRQGTDKFAPLHLATVNNAAGVIALLIERGANVQLQNRFMETPLHLAGDLGFDDVVRMLLDAGADVAIRDEAHRTPLLRAIRNEHLAVARYLVEHGADVNDPDENGVTPLHLAAAAGDANLLRTLLESGAKPNVVEHTMGYTPLHWAALQGDIRVAEALVQRAADLEAENRDGITALQIACQAGHSALATRLLAAGANANATASDSGWSVLHFAALTAEQSLATRLIAHGANPNAADGRGWTPLHVAVMYGHAAPVRELLAAGADVNAADEDGNTPLHIAVQHFHTPIVFLLTGMGADVTRVNRNGETAAVIAERAGDMQSAQALAVNSQNRDARNALANMRPGHRIVLTNQPELLDQFPGALNEFDDEGLTPLHLAARLGNSAMTIRLLAREELSPTSRDNHGYLALHYAAESGDVETLRAAFGSSETVNDAQNISRSTPLHLATARGHEPAVAFLIDNRADVNATDGRGWTALHHAAFLGNARLLNLLKRAGASLDATDLEGDTPADIAERFHSDDLGATLR